MRDKVITEVAQDNMKIIVFLSKEEITLLRNVLSDIASDKIGIGLNLKIANALLDAKEIA